MLRELPGAPGSAKALGAAIFCITEEQTTEEGTEQLSHHRTRSTWDAAEHLVTFQHAEPISTHYTDGAAPQQGLTSKSASGGRGAPQKPQGCWLSGLGLLSFTWQRVSRRGGGRTKSSSRLHRSRGQSGEARTSGPMLPSVGRRASPGLFKDELFRRKHPILLLSFPGWKALPGSVCGRLEPCAARHSHPALPGVL